jgi:ribosome biogenesis protein ENP2
MLLTANEGRQQYAFFIPQLGPAPKWCGFLDNLVEEMAEDADADPNAFNSRSKAGEVYDNFKFVSEKELHDLDLGDLIGTNVLRPYMHGYFVPQGRWEKARLIANPEILLHQRQKSIQEKIDKERDSRIRGNKKVAVKVNRKLAEKIVAREEDYEKKKAAKRLKKGMQELPDGDAQVPGEMATETAIQHEKATNDLGIDSRFKALFENEDFEIDETSKEFGLQNPSSVPAGELKKRGLTAVEDEAMQDVRGSSDDDDESDDDEDGDAQAEAAALRARQRPRPQSEGDGIGRIGSISYKKSGKQRQQRNAGPRMQVSSSNAIKLRNERSKQAQSFGDRSASQPMRNHSGSGVGVMRGGDVVGEKEVTFSAPKAASKKQQQQKSMADAGESGRRVARGKERRSASGNTMRNM